jgi:hypothetical protein
MASPEDIPSGKGSLKPSQTFSRFLFWTQERGTWQYDLAVAAVLLFVFLIPRSWFHDQVEPTSPTAAVQLLTEEPAARLKVYRVSAELIPEADKGVRERAVHEVVSKNLQPPFTIVRIEPVAEGDGSVLWYVVTVRK